MNGRFARTNGIASFCRSNSHRARQLLLELATCLRRSIQDVREYIPLSDEMERVKSYLAIEHARFGERIRFEMAIEPLAEHWPVPRPAGHAGKFPPASPRPALWFDLCSNIQYFGFRPGASGESMHRDPKPIARAGQFR